MTRLPRYLPKKKIGTLSSLAATVGTDLAGLTALLETPCASRYTALDIPKKNNKIRRVYNPIPELKRIQRNIIDRIFSLIVFPDYLYGSLPSDEMTRDYIACAAVHCSAGLVIKADIRDFFDNISAERVHQLFGNEFFHFPPRVAEALTSLCTCFGHTPQGAPTSSYIANLVFYKKERDLVDLLQTKEFRYTRFVDDITISHASPNASYDYEIKSLKRLVEPDFELNEKCEVRRAGLKPLIVHGIRVNHENPRLTATEIRNIRAAVRHVEIAATAANARKSRDYHALFNKTQGRVTKLARVRHKSHKTLSARLNRILPLPSEREREKLPELVSKLENRYAKMSSSSASYRRSFYHLVYRLNIFQRIYKHEAEKLRERLRKVAPK